MPATNPYYQDQFTGQPGQSAKAEQVNSELQGVQSGFDGVNVDIVRALKAPSGETLADMPNAAARAGLWLRFDTNGNPEVVTTPLNVRGNWVANTAYGVGDAYNSTPNGTLYYVNTAYTSGATFGATDLANTSIMVNLTGLFFTTPVVVTGPATTVCAAGKNYGCNSIGGALTFTLPTAALGDSPVSFTYLGGAASTVTINAAAGQFINGVSQTSLVMDITGFSTSLQYWGASYGWRVRTMG
jgi:hypothetical protein